MAIVYEGDRTKGLFYKEKDRRVQPRPYVKPLYYLSSGTSVPYRHPEVYIDLANAAYPMSPESTLIKISRTTSNNIVIANNKALDKMYDRMNQASDLLVAWKERQSALDLIASRVGDLVRVARAIKRRDPNIVRAIKKRQSRKRDIAKDPAGLWLQYHFAIVPTIMDIHHAAELFSFVFPEPVINFSSGGDWNDSYTHYKGDSRHQYNTAYVRYRVKLGCTVEAVNPNIQLATMLGFGQPLSVAWEMTPFSWFVDYFVNVGQLVQNLEPRFPAFKLKNYYMTTLTKVDGMYIVDYYGHRKTVFQPCSSYMMERKLSWPNYGLTFNSPLALKAQQASYITAVLVNILSGFRK